MKNGTHSWTFYPEQIGGGNTSYVIKKLDDNTAYKIRLSAKNAMGEGSLNTWQGWVQTLDKGKVMSSFFLAILILWSVYTIFCFCSALYTPFRDKFLCL
jgi:hypothetical protein